jgi:hypothetical protein
MNIFESKCAAQRVLLRLEASNINGETLAADAAWGQDADLHSIARTQIHLLQSIDRRHRQHDQIACAKGTGQRAHLAKSLQVTAGDQIGAGAIRTHQ